MGFHVVRQFDSVTDYVFLVVEIQRDAKQRKRNIPTIQRYKRVMLEMHKPLSQVFSGQHTIKMKSRLHKQYENEWVNLPDSYLVFITLKELRELIKEKVSKE